MSKDADMIKIVCPGCRYKFDVTREFIMKAEKIFCCNCTKAYDLESFGQASKTELEEEVKEELNMDDYFDSDPDGGFWDD